MVVPSPEESINTHVEGFLSVYTYLFTLGPLDPVIVAFCKRYDVTPGQIHPSFWRIVILLRFISSKIDGCLFTLDHLMRLYNPRLYRRGLINLARRDNKASFSSIDETCDRGSMGRFVRIRTSDLILAENLSFPEKGNMNRE